MTIFTTILLLILRFFADDTPTTTTTEPPKPDEDEEHKQWLTREAFDNFRSSVENRLDRLTETLTGSGDEPESKKRTMLTPASEDDELTQSESTKTPDPHKTPEPTPETDTLVPRRRRAIWERNPPMRRVKNESTPDVQKPTS